MSKGRVCALIVRELRVRASKRRVRTEMAREKMAHTHEFTTVSMGVHEGARVKDMQTADDNQLDGRFDGTPIKGAQPS